MTNSPVLILSARTRRISLFVDQLGLQIAARCIEADVPTAALFEEQGFVEHIYTSMCANEDAYPLSELIELISDGGAAERLFRQYRKGLR